MFASVCGLGLLCGGSEPSGVTTALSAAGLLNLAILVHEAGHLAAARVMGVAVQEFAVGIGPRVAWWQTPSMTYSLRALPLFGYVSFLTSAGLAARAAAAGSAAGPAAAAAAGIGGAPGQLKLLEWLSPGRRAVVMAAGVAANAALAAAFVSWQVYSQGVIGVVTRPGARVEVAAGYSGPPLAGAQRWHPGAGQQQAPGAAAAGGHNINNSGGEDGLLRKGDIILSVAGRVLPVGVTSGLSKLIVEALEAAADNSVSAKVLAQQETLLEAARSLLRGTNTMTAAAPRLAAAADATEMVMEISGVLVDAVDAGEVPAAAAAGWMMAGKAMLKEEAEAIRERKGAAGIGAPRALRGVKMAVLRTSSSSGGSGSGGGAAAAAANATGAVGVDGCSSGLRREVVQLDAAQLLSFDSLVVSANSSIGCRRPATAWEAGGMVWKEMASWTRLVFRSWGQALGLTTTSTTSPGSATTATATTASTPSSSVSSTSTATTTVTPAVSGADGSAGGGSSGTASSPSSSGSPSRSSGPGSGPGSGSGSGSGSQIVGPLGLLASAAALGSTSSSADSWSQLVDSSGAPPDLVDESLAAPSLLLQIGIQLNLQLFFVNLLPLPVLDGGQLLMVALEAARGGRKLPAGVQRFALLASGLAVGGWVAAISVCDMVGLLDRAAGRLASALETPGGAPGGPDARAAVTRGSGGSAAGGDDEEYDIVPAGASAVGSCAT